MCESAILCNQVLYSLAACMTSLGPTCKEPPHRVGGLASETSLHCYAGATTHTHRSHVAIYHTYGPPTSLHTHIAAVRA